MKSAFIAFAIYLTSLAVHAQEVIDVTHQVKLPMSEKNLTREDFMRQAVEEVSLENIKLLIGEAKADRNKAAIENKIIKNSGKYVLSMRSGPAERIDGFQQANVELKISLKNLRAMLLKEGLLYQLEGPPKVLPVITVGDRVNSRQFGWWYQRPTKDLAFVAGISKEFSQYLKDELTKIGFYGLAPEASGFAKSVPEPYRNSNLQRNDALFLGEFFKSSIVVRGDILVRAKPNSENRWILDVKLEALHTSNGRILGEVVRTFETDIGPLRTVAYRTFKDVGERMAADMAVQLSDAWKKGTFGASLLRLTVRGSLDPKELDQLKQVVLLKVRDVKSLRERLIRADSTTYEIDSSTTPYQLAQAFKTASLAPFKVEVEDVRSDGLVLVVRK